jgi:uncharacterized protein DUF4382/carboxypeptidase family protein
MRRTHVIALAAGASISLLAALAACGSDGPTPVTTGNARTSVLLTDAPFPYDAIARVDLYIESIAVSSRADTSGGPGSVEWVTVAEPKRTFNLLDLQNGKTALLGDGVIPPGQYRAVRMVLDTQKSRIVDNAGKTVDVAWQSSAGHPTLFALVEAPIAMGASGGEIVIDFDVGRSFACLADPCTGLTFLPWFRAVDRSRTGGVAGVVRAPNAGGQMQPMPNVGVSIYTGDASQPQDYWRLAATGKTDAQGAYHIAFLMPGSYTVRVDPPRALDLAPGSKSGITVSAGQEVTGADVSLAKAADAAITLEAARTQLAQFDTVFVTARVRTPDGEVASPAVTWTTSNPAVAIVNPIRAGFAAVYATGSGSATITASYAGRSASLTVTVTAGQSNPPGGGTSNGPIATMAISPVNATATVGDSLSFVARLLDADGKQVVNKSVTWSTSNAAIATIRASGATWVVVDATAAGTAVITAKAEGKEAAATLTVKPKP